MLELISRRLREVTVPPRGGRRREDPLGCADGRAPLSALPGLGRAKCAPRRSARRALAGARGLARRCVQAPGPRPLDRVAARAAVSPPSPHRQQRAVPHLARVRRGEPRFAGAGAEPSPALGRLPRNAWPSNSEQKPSSIRPASPARATGRRTGRRWATPAALPASPARPRPGSPTADRRRSWSTRWPATRASKLCRLDDAPKWRSEGDPRPWTAHRLRSLWECLHGVPDFRSTRGRRYPLATILAIAVAAKLAGYHGATAIGEFSQALTQHQLRALRAFYSPRLGRFTAPSTTAFVKVLTNLDPDVLDRAARTWAAQQASRTDPVAIDGKYIRGAARHNPGAKHLLVAAAEHRSGIVLGQEAVEDKSNEIPAVRTLVTGLDLTGRVVTLDAMHTNHHTARCLVEQCGAHYVMTAVKDNCPQLARRVGWARLGASSGARHRASHLGQGTRTNREAKLPGARPHRAPRPRPLPHRQVAFRIERERRIVKTGKVEHETVHGLTSVPPDQAHLAGRPGPGARALEHRKSTPPRARRLLRRRPLPGANRPPAAQSRLPHEPRHLHRSPQGALRLPPPSPPALRSAAPGRRAPAHQPAQTLSPTLLRPLGAWLHHRANVPARPAGQSELPVCFAYPSKRLRYPPP